MQATVGLSGSFPDGLNAAQPHDQMVGTWSSPAICFAASASHLTTSSHLPSGWRFSRPPAPRVELNCSIIPSLDVGMPIWIRSSSRARIVPRRRLLPSTAPCFETDGPEK